MNRSIYLDDNRKPRNPQDYTDTARNYTEFRLLLEGIVAAGDKVEFVDFDYILSDFPDPNWPFPHEKNGYHCAKLLRRMDQQHSILHEDFYWNVHSSEPKYNVEVHKFLQDYVEGKKANA